MSLAFFLTDTITVERATFTQDSMGGESVAYAAISSATTAIPAIVYKHSEKTQKPILEFGRRDWKGEFAVVTNVACGAKPGDRVNHGSVYYDILDVFDYGHPRLNTSAVYVMDCNLVRSASGTT